MKNARLFDGVYTLPIRVSAGTVNNPSTPIFFTGYPYLKGKKVKAINYNYRSGSAVNIYYIFFTFYNSKGEQLIYNLPASDIINSSSPSITIFNQTRLRLFDLYDLDLQRSYWIYTQNVAWGSNFTPFEINFYL